jgi:hypothetical protein
MIIITIHSNLYVSTIPILPILTLIIMVIHSWRFTRVIDTESIVVIPFMKVVY